MSKYLNLASLYNFLQQIPTLYDYNSAKSQFLHPPIVLLQLREAGLPERIEEKNSYSYKTTPFGQELLRLYPTFYSLQRKERSIGEIKDELMRKAHRKKQSSSPTDYFITTLFETSTILSTLYLIGFPKLVLIIIEPLFMSIPDTFPISAPSSFTTILSFILLVLSA